jgi:hypothetical protein
MPTKIRSRIVFFPFAIENMKIKMCRTISLLGFKVGFKLILSFGAARGRGEGRRLRMFENRVLRKMFGPKRKEVRRTGRACMHNKQLHGLQTPSNSIRIAKPNRMRW